MNILAVDSSAVTASVAVLRDGRVAGEASFTNGLTHSRMLMPMVDYVLKGAGLTAGDIDLFAAANGPGSFTGLRIGIGTVKGMAYACGKKCVGVSTLLALACNVGPTDRLVVPIMDARRGQVYTAIYRHALPLPLAELEPTALAIEDLCAKIDGAAIFVGDGVKVYGEKIKALMGEKAVLAPPQLELQRAASVAYAARFLEGTAPQELGVVYLRKPQAEREREEKIHGN